MTKKFSNKRSMGRTDWDRIDHMTDEAIQAAAESDPDAQPDDESFWEKAEVLTPEERHALRVGKKTGPRSL